MFPGCRLCPALGGSVLGCLFPTRLCVASDRGSVRHFSEPMGLKTLTIPLLARQNAGEELDALLEDLDPDAFDDDDL